MTGPSFSLATSICAPKRPVATSTPRERSSLATASSSGSARSGAAACVNAGRRPVRISASSVNCETTSAAARPRFHAIGERAVEAPVPPGEEPQLRQLARDPPGVGACVVGRDADVGEQALADRADLLARDRDAGCADALNHRAH